ncbi:MAG: helix-turn-helix domain-containing protein [Alphaproteobacteria bacterium]|jgi:DNA-binding transcriptional regulator YdaS (Cro superfamily)|nr:helix-turn-helix domain-containing protein [Alphaproteobacteria bacterium]
MKDPSLIDAIYAAGGNNALARAIGVTPSAISQWDRVPAQRVLQVERATGGKVGRRQLRPDLYADETPSNHGASPRRSARARDWLILGTPPSCYAGYPLKPVALLSQNV